MIYSYKFGSASAKVLAKGLRIKRIKHKNSRFKGGPHKTVINWGCSDLPIVVRRCNIVNSPESVCRASNKLHFFSWIQYINEEVKAGIHGDRATVTRIPWFTTDKDEAGHAILNGSTIVCRTKLTGNSGDGIVMATNLDELVDAPLYTEYVPKLAEYRVHVCEGGVFDIQQKKRNRDILDEGVNWKVRNHDNGFIFARNNLDDTPQDVLNQAVSAVVACGLDFGAVDVVWNSKQGKAYVLEVNTAPGLTGSTLDNYINKFKERGYV